MSALITRARKFATEAHASIDQRRKYTGEPYIVHPLAVTELVNSVPHTDDMVAAALLHDVVEDTPVTSEEIHAEFGPVVGALVDWLTDVSRPHDGNRRLLGVGTIAARRIHIPASLVDHRLAIELVHESGLALWRGCLRGEDQRQQRGRERCSTRPAR